MSKKNFVTVFILLCGLFNTPSSFAQFENLKKTLNSVKPDGLSSLKSTKLSDTKIGQGLKEALKVGITNAVQTTGQADGYFKNDAIKILMPEKLKTLDQGLRMIGFGDKLDEFVLSMNRAAEKAAPAAEKIFLDALFDMSIEDVQKIYSGGDTAATDYFKNKTYNQLTAAFQPAVDKALSQYSVTDQYKALLGRYQKIPLAKNLSAPDVDDYVITKALDGLFSVLGDQEKKIRTDPKARVTDLLKEVFK